MLPGIRPRRGALWCLGIFLGAAAGLWLDVPYVRQPKDGCGAACIVMVLEYWAQKDPRFHVSLPGLDAIQSKLYSRASRGIPASSMVGYLRQEGLRVFTFRGTWNEINEHLSKGRPLIVCLREGRGLDRTLHYVVVTGIDTARGFAIVNDPAVRRQMMMRRTSFEKKWRGEDNWTLLAVPAS